jgi:hypothetical protein
MACFEDAIEEGHCAIARAFLRLPSSGRTFLRVAIARTLARTRYRRNISKSGP